MQSSIYYTTTHVLLEIIKWHSKLNNAAGAIFQVSCRGSRLCPRVTEGADQVRGTQHLAVTWRHIFNLPVITTLLWRRRSSAAALPSALDVHARPEPETGETRWRSAAWARRTASAAAWRRPLVDKAKERRVKSYRAAKEGNDSIRWFLWLVGVDYLSFPGAKISFCHSWAAFSWIYIYCARVWDR